MKNIDKYSKESQEKVRIAIGIFLVMCFASLFVGVFNLEDNIELGILFLAFAVMFLGVTLYAYYNPILSTVIGLILYTILVIWICIAFPGIMFGQGKRSFATYLIMGFVLIFTALIDSFRHRKSK